jgi:hypothetical protein
VYKFNDFIAVTRRQMFSPMHPHTNNTVEARSLTARLRPGEVPVDMEDTAEYDEDLESSDDIDSDDWVVQESDLDDADEEDLSDSADEVSMYYSLPHPKLSSEMSM